MEESERKYWVAAAQDNSVPRPAPDEGRGFWSMWENASPVVAPTDEGYDALCVFSTDGGVIAYLRGLEREELIGGATAFPLSGREDFREFFTRWSVSYVVVDPELGAVEDASVTVEVFLADLDDEGR
jgi:hypothetical protein